MDFVVLINPLKSTLIPYPLYIFFKDLRIYIPNIYINTLRDKLYLLQLLYLYLSLLKKKEEDRKSVEDPELKQTSPYFLKGSLILLFMAVLHIKKDRETRIEV